MHHLPRCVYARVRPSGTHDFDLFIGNLAQRLFEARLYALAGPLTLPTVVRRSVVLKT
jgi:hypothetical protein